MLMVVTRDVVVKEGTLDTPTVAGVEDLADVVMATRREEVRTVVVREVDIVVVVGASSVVASVVLVAKAEDQKNHHWEIGRAHV